MARRKVEKNSRAGASKKASPTRGGKNDVTDEAREAAVEALLVNPELGVPEIKRRYKLTVSTSLLYKYRKALREGREPWVQAARGGRPRVKTPTQPGERSTVARSVAEAGRVSDALASVGAGPVESPIADNPEQRKSPEYEQGSELAGSKFDDSRNLEKNFSSGTGVPAGGQDLPKSPGDPGVRPPELSKKLASARRQALERVNLLAAEVAMKALQGLKQDLGEDSTVRAKDKAVIAALASDRFLATSASLEELNPGTSGVAGALSEIKDNKERYRSERRKFEEELKRRLKVVKIKDYQNTMGWRMSDDDEGEVPDVSADGSGE